LVGDSLSKLTNSLGEMNDRVQLLFSLIVVVTSKIPK